MRMEKFDKSNPYKPSLKNPYSKKTLLIIGVGVAVFFILLIKLVGNVSPTIGKYTKEELPKDFNYKITKDESDVNIEKNQLYVEISEKLTIGQIATLAEELFNSKDKQRRFYISYKLKGRDDSPYYWAYSNFDPDLEIEIIGSTNNQDTKMIDEAKKVSGNMVGIYTEKEYTFSMYTVYEKDGETHIKISLKNGQFMDDVLIKTITKGGIKLDYNDGKYNGEYFILNNSNELEFYNKENKKFTTGYVIK